MNTNRKKEILRVIKIALFSASAGIIEMVLFSLLYSLAGLPYVPSYLTALVASVLWNFTLNREFTFKAANNIPIAMMKVALFYLIFTPVSSYIGHVLSDKLLWNGYLVTVINMASNFILEFLYDRFFVFGQSIDSKEKTQEENKKENP